MSQLTRLRSEQLCEVNSRVGDRSLNLISKKVCVCDYELSYGAVVCFASGSVRWQFDIIAQTGRLHMIYQYSPARLAA